jgi:hypothetical protein
MQFATVVSEESKRWLKVQAAAKGKSMATLFEGMVAERPETLQRQGVKCQSVGRRTALMHKPQNTATAYIDCRASRAGICEGRA